MIILHISPVDTTRANGLRFSVPQLASAQQDLPFNQVAIFSISNRSKVDFSEIEQYRVPYFFEYKNIGQLPEPFNKPDIVIFHGVYHHNYIQLFNFVKEYNIPYIITPRVSLTEGAQKAKFFKKKLWNFVFFDKYINSANGIHYLTVNEEKTSVETSTYNFVCGNGISLPDKKNTLLKNKDNINITFIGRYAISHKGLDVLVKSLIFLKNNDKLNNITINLYGSDFRNGKRKIFDLLENNNLLEDCYLNDAVYGTDKHIVLKNTDIFIAPSRYEGHPQTIIEALAYGIPCIVTEGTNMKDDILRYSAGWSTELNEKKIANTIIRAISEKKDIVLKGSNARRMAEIEFSWIKIANNTIDEYNKMILAGSL